MAAWKYDWTFLVISIILFHVIEMSVPNLNFAMVAGGYGITFMIYGIAYILTLKRGFRW